MYAFSLRDVSNHALSGTRSGVNFVGKDFEECAATMVENLRKKQAAQQKRATKPLFGLGALRELPDETKDSAAAKLQADAKKQVIVHDFFISFHDNAPTDHELAFRLHRDLEALGIATVLAARSACAIAPAVES